MRNFNETFRKDVAYDNIKRFNFTKNHGFNLPLEDTFLAKPQGGWVKLIASRLQPPTPYPNLLRIKKHTGKFLLPKEIH